MTRFAVIRAEILRERSLFNKVAVVVAAVGAAAALRAAMGAIADPVPFATFFPAIVLCALLAGWRFGIVAMIASALVVNWIFMAPRFTLVADHKNVGMVTLFFASSAILVLIAQNLRDALRELERANERASILNRELLHRGRNMLAIVQALAEQSVRADPAGFLPTFSKRLGALASAQSVLSESDGSTCSIGAIVEKSCAAFRSEGSFEVEGPACHLPAESCVPLSLALHELCTNALKYGALSVPSGKVRVVWGRPVGGATTLVWEETGGPEVRPPTRKGLGTLLLTSQPKIGKADLQFHPHGVRCEIVLNVAEG